MARRVVTVRGFRELDKALGELPKSVSKPLLTRVAKRALEPMRAKAEALAPKAKAPYTIGRFAKGTLRTVFPGRLRDSLVIGAKRTRRARKAREPKRGVKLAMGVGSGNGALWYGALDEFGTVDTPAQPFMRPAWDGEAEGALEIIKDELGSEIAAAAKRHAGKLARARAKKG